MEERRILFYSGDDIPNSAVKATNGATCKTVYIPLWNGSGQLKFTVSSGKVKISKINGKSLSYTGSYWTSNGPTSMTAIDGIFSANNTGVVTGNGYSKGIRCDDGSYANNIKFILTPCMIYTANDSRPFAGSIDGIENTYAKVQFANTVTISGSNDYYYIDD